MSQIKICPSLLSSNWANLASECSRLELAGADWLHIDVMDGHFVPNLTVGAPVVKCLRRETTMFLDCHLMISNPERYVKDFIAAGADGITFHIEATNNPVALCREVRNAGRRVGIALKPNTPVESVENIIAEVDMVLVMTVEPGFGGQSFMMEMLTKVQHLSKYVVDIQVDGGIDRHNVQLAYAAGANVVVAGSSVFNNGDLAENIKALRPLL